MSTKYDPKLKECMARIENLCREYDCGAYVSLVSPTHGEFRYVLPNWTSLYEEVQPDGRVGIRLRHKKADGDTHEKAELTAHFLHSLMDTSAVCFGFLDNFIQVTDEKWKTKHTPFSGFRPHKKEN